MTKMSVQRVLRQLMGEDKRKHNAALRGDKGGAGFRAFARAV